ncbi:glycosyltransferase family 4 protein [Buttiauxella sp. A2-C2_NF]|uniref:glycosyltransferase family 4 protein n=1 Tax=Buttiauxella ferragutiae TaxID=82989 RepID=UPI001E541664|nr:glycosyltransferase family 4 protein [Buttiauxella ferragutiae]MCE0826700.1 glycosyltransferase family 4 protein [Buttiauxella ferragutiae]
MKICIIIPSNKKCSPNNLAVNIAKYISADNSVDVLYLKNSSEDAINNSGFQYVIRKMRCFDFFNLNKYDVVHSHLFKPDVINALFSILYRPRRTKTISTVHSNIFLDLSGYIKNKTLSTIVSRAWIILLNKLDFRVVVSSSLGIAHKHKLRDFIAIPNGIKIINSNDYTNDTDQIDEAERFRVGVLTRLHPGKGIEDAFYLARNNNRVEVHIYGNGMLEQQCLDASEKYSNIYFHGYAKDVKSSYEKMDVFLMSSRHEGFGMTILEALNYKVPVICYNIPVFKEILGDGGYYYNNEVELIDIVNDYIENHRVIFQEQIERLKFFDEELMFAKYSKLYCGCLSENKMG